MKINDFVELINSLEYLEEKGIFKESKGTIIKLENNIASVLFFNEKTWEIMQSQMSTQNF